MPSKTPHLVHVCRTIAGGPQICARCRFILSGITTATGHELVWADGELVGVATDERGQVEAAWGITGRLRPFERYCRAPR